MSGTLFAQQARLVDCPIELAEHVSLWDKLIGEKLATLYPSQKMFENCSLITFEQALQNGAQLLDVRTQEEYNEDHIADALLIIDIRKDDFDEQAVKLLQPGKPVAVYCRGGVRSRKASERLLLRLSSL
jgi:rhodanese-related sulfurtransferase